MTQSKVHKLYILRLNQAEIAMIAESLKVIEQVEADNGKYGEAAKLKALGEKLLIQASQSEVSNAPRK